MDARVQSANPPAASGKSLLLKVEDLRISFRRSRGQLLPVVDSANLSLDRHEAVGVVGESGSGKTMLCRALIGTLARRGAEVIGGRVLLDGRDLAGAPEAVWRRVLGRRIVYVPPSSLAGQHEVLSVGILLVE